MGVDEVVRPRLNRDVLMGKLRNEESNLPGNMAFTELIQSYVGEYLHTPHGTKFNVARKVVGEFTKHGGRFLRRDGDVYHMVTDKVCIANYAYSKLLSYGKLRNAVNFGMETRAAKSRVSPQSRKHGTDDDLGHLAKKKRILPAVSHFTLKERRRAARSASWLLVKQRGVKICLSDGSDMDSDDGWSVSTDCDVIRGKKNSASARSTKSALEQSPKYRQPFDADGKAGLAMGRKQKLRFDSVDTNATRAQVASIAHTASSSCVPSTQTGESGEVCRKDPNSIEGQMDSLTERNKNLLTKHADLVTEIQVMRSNPELVDVYGVGLPTASLAVAFDVFESPTSKSLADLPDYMRMAAVYMEQVMAQNEQLEAELQTLGTILASHEQSMHWIKKRSVADEKQAQLLKRADEWAEKSSAYTKQLEEEGNKWSDLQVNAHFKDE